MSFDITHFAPTELFFYAILFSAVDLTKAWNPSTNQFEQYTLATQTNFALTLVEDEERTGWYTYSISDTTNIPPVTGDQYYFIEIWKQEDPDADPSREDDCPCGGQPAFWGQECTGGGGDCDCPTVQEIWEYNNRTLTDSLLTAQQIWEYINRTLTECPCDFSELSEKIQQAINDLKEQISNISKEVKEDIANSKKLPKINIQKPKITPNNKGPGSNIKP